MKKHFAKNLTDEEKKLFESAMENVGEISSRTSRFFDPVGQNPLRRAQGTQKASAEKRCRRPTSYLTAGLPGDVDRKTMLRLKRGHLRPESRLDLHGMSQSEAFTSLVHFVTQSHSVRLRCILAITGKGNLSQGGGVLRNQLPNWLNGQELRPYILGFSEAQPRDGGGGAFYILLRRRRS